MPALKLSVEQINVLVPILEALRDSQSVVNQTNSEIDVADNDKMSANSALRMRTGKATLHMLVLLARQKASGKTVPILDVLNSITKVNKDGSLEMPFEEAFNTFCTSNFKSTAPYKLKDNSLRNYFRKSPHLFAGCKVIQKAKHSWLAVKPDTISATEMAEHVKNGFPASLIF